MPRITSRSSDSASSMPVRASSISFLAPPGSASKLLVGQAQPERGADQLGLGAVVQVPLDAAQLGAVRLQGLRAGLGQRLHARGQLGAAGRAEQARGVPGLEPGQSRLGPELERVSSPAVTSG